MDDKYQYSCENKDNKVHGFICFDPLVGFWQITPSNEFRTGGPVKQDLTSHVNPTTLAVCSSFTRRNSIFGFWGIIFILSLDSSSDHKFC